MSRMLTSEEWKEVKAPFWVIRITNKDWQQIDREMICKWIKMRCGGWFYYNGIDTLVFELRGDWFMTVIWLKSVQFDKEAFEISEEEFEDNDG